MKLPNLFATLPWATRMILLVTVVVFLLQLMAGQSAFDAFALWPIGAGDYSPEGGLVRTFMPWQLLSYSFVHAGFGHLFFNMLALVMFGAQLEATWGRSKFLRYWFVCVACAGLCQLLVLTWLLREQGVLGAAMGASGGVYGLVLAFGLMFPYQRVSIFPLPFLLKARTVAFAYVLLSLCYGLFSSGDGVAHFAHLAGMAAGWVMLKYNEEGGGRGKKTKKNHLRAVR